MTRRLYPLLFLWYNPAMYERFAEIQIKQEDLVS